MVNQVIHQRKLNLWRPETLLKICFPVFKSSFSYRTALVAASEHYCSSKHQVMSISSRIFNMLTAKELSEKGPFIRLSINVTCLSESIISEMPNLWDSFFFLEKKVQKVFGFLNNYILSDCCEFFLLWREYSWSAVNVLTSILKSQIWQKMTSKSICLKFIKPWVKIALLQISAVFGTC